MEILYDMHDHLCFSPRAAALARELGTLGVRSLCATVEPREFAHVRAELHGAGNVALGLGLHPWNVPACGAQEAVAEFEELLPGATVVGEIGLDYAPRHERTRDAQLAAFRRIAAACARSGGHVLSIHLNGRGAAADALDALESAGCLDSCTCVLHWFHGSSPELQRARSAGCLFSIGERMLATRQGTAYARELPDSALLLETDLPSALGDDCSAGELRASLLRAQARLAQLRGVAEPQLACVLRENGGRLWSLAVPSRQTP